VTDLFPCACCTKPLEPAQQLRFLVETDNLDNPSFLNRIRMLPALRGRPVPVCQACQSRIESEPPKLALPRPKAPLNLIGALGALSIGWLLGTLLTSRA
jgi:hypothetical protein